MKTYEKISLLIFTIHYLVCEGGSLGNDIKKKLMKGLIVFQVFPTELLKQKEKWKNPKL